MQPKYPNIEVQLSGTDGNAIGIMMKVKRALQRASVDPDELDSFQQEALSGDYQNVLRTAMNWVTVL